MNGTVTGRFYGSSYETDELFAVVDRCDNIVAVGIRPFKTKVAFLKQYESFPGEDFTDADWVDRHFVELCEENGAELVQLNATYTVHRSEKV